MLQKRNQMQLLLREGRADTDELNLPAEYPKTHLSKVGKSNEKSIGVLSSVLSSLAEIPAGADSPSEPKFLPSGMESWEVTLAITRPSPSFPLNTRWELNSPMDINALTNTNR